MPAAARDLQADGVGDARAERAVLGGGLVDRDAHRHALAHLAHRLAGRAPAPRRARGRPARARRSRAPPRSTSQAPLASRRSATSGPAAARTAATRPASSPTPTFTFTQPKPARDRRARPARRRPRGRAPTIVALTGDRGGRVVGEQRRDRPPARRPARSHSARSTAASASGRSSHRAAGVEQLRAVESPAEPREHRRGSARAPARTRSMLDAVVGLAAAPPRRSPVDAVLAGRARPRSSSRSRTAP